MSPDSKPLERALHRRVSVVGNVNCCEGGPIVGRAYVETGGEESRKRYHPEKRAVVRMEGCLLGLTTLVRREPGRSSQQEASSGSVRLPLLGSLTFSLSTQASQMPFRCLQSTMCDSTSRFARRRASAALNLT